MTTLGEICDAVGGIIKTGPFGAQLHESDYTDEGIPVVMPKDIIEGRVRVAGIARIGPQDVERLSQHKLEPGDIVYGRRGDIGRQALIGRREAGWLCGTGCLRISLGDKIVDPTFLHYYLRDPRVIRDISNQAVGATMPNLNTKILRGIEVRHPDLPTQRKIADILSAYDDLIENNLRRIKILEEMAQSLYREWFVHFRYPGHESVPFVESSLGPVPEGWQVAEIGAITTKVGSGATPRGGKDSYKSDGVPLIRSMNVYDYSFEFIDLAFLDSQQAAQLDNVTVEANDILLNITGASVCRCAMVPSYLVPARVNQHVAIIRADLGQIDPHYLLDCINSDVNKRKLFGLAQGGATREALTKEAICRFPIALPPLVLIRRYGKIAGPLHSLREGLQRRNQTLRRTRDLLLPKLLSPEGALVGAGNPAENFEESCRNA